MPRYIPSHLVGHLKQEATTTCWLLKVVPVSPGTPAYGITELDQDIAYDDGSSPGLLTYSAAIGMIPASVLISSDLSVDNTQIPSLLPEYEVPISEADIRAGLYDYAKFSLYLIDWNFPEGGHVTLSSGTIGEVSIRSDGLSFINELRGLAAELKQSVCSKDSLSCRAIFGSQPIGSSTPGPQVQRDSCKFDATTLLQNGTVGPVGLENTRTFTVSGASGWTDDMLNPGIVYWQTGLNAGRTNEIESNTAAGEITLAFETAFPIQSGDTLQYRPDCSKKARDDSKGCRHWFASTWVMRFRGEPDIPIGDAGQMEMPGSSSGPGQGGRTTQDVAQ